MKPEETLPSGVGRACYRDIDLYAPFRPPMPVDLSDNTNLYGIPPTADRELRGAASPLITRYPGLYADGLKQAIAGYAGVPVECVVTGCGSDDVLDSAIRAFAEPGETIAFSEPSFAMLPLFAQMNGLKAAVVPLKANLDLDVEGLLAQRPKLVYVCSPNNPTGNTASRVALEALLARCEGVVLLDEAYAEYQADPRGLLARAPATPRLLVVRTLSKAFGLAGLRVGYAVGSAALVREVEKSRGPYKVSALAERMGIAALTADRPWVEEKVREVLVNRDRLAQALRGLGLTPLPSEANFLLVPVRGDAKALAAALRERGVSVRPFGKLPLGLGEAVRISVGPWEMMERALGALKEVLR